jgi:hypothetical protein
VTRARHVAKGRDKPPLCLGAELGQLCVFDVICADTPVGAGSQKQKSPTGSSEPFGLPSRAGPTSLVVWRCAPRDIDFIDNHCGSKKI